MIRPWLAVQLRVRSHVSGAAGRRTPAVHGTADASISAATARSSSARADTRAPHAEAAPLRPPPPPIPLASAGRIRGAAHRERRATACQGGRTPPRVALKRLRRVLRQVRGSKVDDPVQGHAPVPQSRPFARVDQRLDPAPGPGGAVPVLPGPTSDQVQLSTVEPSRRVAGQPRGSIAVPVFGLARTKRNAGWRRPTVWTGSRLTAETPVSEADCGRRVRRRHKTRAWPDEQLRDWYRISDSNR